MATLDVVVTAVEYGHGKRHKVLSDYTFSVRADGTNDLVTIGKAYSGLTDIEISTLTEFFKNHTMEDQGPRRKVEPLVVIEVAFNNIQRSNRHESGYALRFPRIVRLRPDKPVSEIDTLERVRQLYELQGK
jgi:DNA ligase-1